MAGEIIKTEGIVLRISPWSQTSHVVTWLTRDHGVVATVVKGAVRPKSAFLGQYDLYYTCEMVYYAHISGDAHVLREVSPLDMRCGLRKDWRASVMAGYAAMLAMENGRADGEDHGWYEMISRILNRLTDPNRSESLNYILVELELETLRLAGIAPDLSGFNPREEWQYFALDGGRYGSGLRTVRLRRKTASFLLRPVKTADADTVSGALRFLGVFIAYHLDSPREVRRDVVKMATSEVPRLSF